MSDSHAVITNYDALSTSSRRELALDCLTAGIDAAHPRRVIQDAVTLDEGVLRIHESSYDLSEFSELIVLGGGKAAGQVVVELEEILGDHLDGGVVVTNAVTESNRVAVRRGDHPVPSENGVENTRAILEQARNAGTDTLILGAITGGGSALLAAPADGIGIEELQETTTQLLESGATIHEINAVRKHLSTLKGGLLARAASPATVACLVLSDVVGNDLDVIASGPFVPDQSTFTDAIAVLDRYDVTVPDAVRERLERGVNGDFSETPTANDPVFERIDHHIVADGMTAIDAAKERVSETRYGTLILSSRIRGESSEAAKTAAAIAEEVRATGNPIEPPAVLISGGETTVTVSGDGTGGPNQEYALGCAAELDIDGITVAAVDTDGIDGPTDAAGGIVDSIRQVDEDVRDALFENDVYPLLKRRDGLIFTGKTGTNVNDLRVIVIDEESP